MIESKKKWQCAKCGRTYAESVTWCPNHGVTFKDFFKDISSIIYTREYGIRPFLGALSAFILLFFGLFLIDELKVQNTTIEFIVVLGLPIIGFFLFCPIRELIVLTKNLGKTILGLLGASVILASVVAGLLLLVIVSVWIFGIVSAWPSYVVVIIVLLLLILMKLGG